MTSSTNENGAAHEYVVQGMTCSHCVASVREEVAEVAGVENVDVDLASGRMVVNGDGAALFSGVSATRGEHRLVKENLLLDSVLADDRDHRGSDGVGEPGARDSR